MKKCPSCGAEFEGRFCPECGTKFPETPRCPRCGAAVRQGARFCSECGSALNSPPTTEVPPATKVPPAAGASYPFPNPLPHTAAAQTDRVPPSAAAPAPSSFSAYPPHTQTAQPALPSWQVRFGRALEWLPAVLLLFFSLLVFAFYCAPLQEFELFGVEVAGNAYEIAEDDRDENAMLLKVMIVSSAVFAVCAAVLAIGTAAARYNTARRRTLQKLTGFLAVVVCLFHPITAILIIVRIREFDGGAGLFKAGACPVLLLVFFPVLAVLLIAACLLRSRLRRKDPGLPSTPAREKPRKTEAERKTNARMWRRLACVFIVTALLLGALAVLTITMSDIFRVSRVREVTVGMSQSQVRSLLGEPYEPLSSDGRWVWLDKRSQKLSALIEENAEQQAEALFSLSEEKLDRLIAEGAALEAKWEKQKNKQIEVYFDEKGKVFSVFLNRGGEGGKTVKEVSVPVLPDAVSQEFWAFDTPDGPMPLTRGVDFTLADSAQASDKSATPVFCAEYTDGSYYSGPIDAYEWKAEESVLRWEDARAAYSYSVTVNDTKNMLGKIDRNGVYDNSNSHVRTLVLPDRVTGIRANAFTGCHYLESITIPSSVTSIGKDAFAGCGSLARVDIDDLSAWLAIRFESAYANPLCFATLYINGTPANDTPATAYEIPAGTTHIDSYTFVGMVYLTEITIPASVTSIDEGAFEGCTRLKRVNIEDISAWCGITFGNLTANPAYFAGCLYLAGNLIEHLEIPAGVTRIGDYAFANVDFTDVTIGADVSEIGYNAFYDCEPERVTFAVPTGWTLTKSAEDTAGEPADISDPEQNAYNLTKRYCERRWIRTP